MILRTLLLIFATLLVGNVQADVAPEITTLAEGYNIVAKLPCLGCPFLYQDSASGQDEGWKVREDENALVSRNIDSKLSFNPRSLRGSSDRLLNTCTTHMTTPNHPNINPAPQHLPPPRLRPSLNQHRQPPHPIHLPPPHLRHPNPLRHLIHHPLLPHRHRLPRKSRLRLLQPLIQLLPPPPPGLPSPRLHPRRLRSMDGPRRARQNNQIR